MKTDTLAYAKKYPEHEAMLVTGHAAILDEAAKRGKEYGMDNLPGPNEPSLDPYSGFIATRYRRLHVEAQQYLDAGMHETEIQTENQAFTERQAELNRKTDALTHENKIAEREIGGRMPEDVRKRDLRRTLIIWAFFACEFLFTAKVFEYQGDDLLTSFAIGLLITFCSYFLARFLTSFLQRAKTEGIRMYLAAGLCAAAGIGLSTIMSVWRAKALSEGNPDATMNPGEFTVINLVIFVVSTLLSYSFLPRKEESEAEKELRAKCDQVARRKKEIDALTKEREEIEAAHRTKVLHHQEVISLAEHTTRRINALYLESMEVFRSGLLAHRSDRLTPKCLYHPIPDLFDLTNTKR